MSAAPVPATETEAITLDRALARADQHPDLAMARADVEAAAGDILTADHAPLPVLSTSAASIDLQNGLGNGSWLGSKLIDKGISLDWTWERGDKRRHRTESAEQAWGAAHLDYLDRHLQRRLIIAAAYWDLVAAQDRESDSRAMLESAEQLAEVARLRLERGDISEQEAGRILIETARARNDHAAIQAARQLAAIALARASGKQSPHLRSVSAWPDAESGQVNIPTAQGLRELIGERADVKASQARVRAAQAALALARALRVPDITWGGGFNNYPPDQRASVQVRAQMPLHFNYQFDGEAKRAAAQLQRAEEETRLIMANAESELLALLMQRRDAAQRLTVFEREILPRSQSVLERAEAAYTRGATPLTELLEARRTHRSVRLEAAQARLDHAKADTEWALRSRPAPPGGALPPAPRR